MVYLSKPHEKLPVVMENLAKETSQYLWMESGCEWDELLVLVLWTADYINLYIHEWYVMCNK